MSDGQALEYLLERDHIWPKYRQKRGWEINLLEKKSIKGSWYWYFPKGVEVVGVMQKASQKTTNGEGNAKFYFTLCQPDSRRHYDIGNFNSECRCERVAR